MVDKAGTEVCKYTREKLEYFSKRRLQKRETTREKAGNTTMDNVETMPRTQWNVTNLNGSDLSDMNGNTTSLMTTTVLETTVDKTIVNDD
jgi:hypothetical protein